MALARKPHTAAEPDPLNSGSIPAGASRIHVLTLRLKRLLDADINRTLSAHSTLSLPQWRILSVLSRCTEPTSQKDLVGYIVIAQGQASRALHALQTEGLVLASQSATDRRSWNYQLSARGRAVFAELLPHMTRRREALEGALTADEREQFHRIASKVAQAVQERLEKA